MSPERFRREARKIVPDLEEDRLEKLLHLARLLRETAHPLGLVGESREERLLSEHILDGLFLVPHLGRGPLADLGSGAGLPGLVLAIARPELEVWLVEPRRKAVSFLEYARALLALQNTRVVRARAEDPELPREYFETVTARALAELVELWPLAEPLLRVGGVLLAPKGPRGPREIEKLRRRWPDLRVESFFYRLPEKGPYFILKIFKGSPS